MTREETEEDSAAQAARGLSGDPSDRQCSRCQATRKPQPGSQQTTRCALDMSSTSDRAPPFNSRAAILEPEAPEKEALDCPVHRTMNSAPTIGLPVAQQLADMAGTGLSDGWHRTVQ
jgi:hypothetical protein